ncbi:MAG: autotransporter assembly complex protein TamA [Parahaliea sp.]
MRVGLLLCCLLPALVLAKAETLVYQVKGLDKTLRHNVEAWLGAVPATESERAAFLSTARERTAKALQALGYYNPVIDLEVDSQKAPWRLTINIDAGEPVRVDKLELQVQGDATADEDFKTLLEAPALHRGEVFNHAHYEEFKKSMLSLAQRRGYFGAHFTRNRVEVVEAANTAAINLHFDSGPRYRFGPLIHDELNLYTSLLQRLRPFEEGEPFLLAKLQEFQSELQRTGYFSGVLVQPRVSEAVDNQVPLAVELSPAKRHSFDVGVGYSTDTQERVSMVWRTPRINRWGHSQETRLEYSRINPSGRITYNIPLTHPLNDVLQLRARLEQNEFGDIDSDQVEFGVRRELRKGNWVYGYSLRYLNEQWDVASYNENSDYLLPGFSLSHKLREGPLVNPDWGFSQFYQFEGASEQAGSDVDLLRAYAKWIYVQRLVDTPHRFVGRLELGAVSVAAGKRDWLAPSLSFFAGGSQSLRGYDYQSLGSEVELTLEDGAVDTLVVGGERLLVGSMEYQYRFNESWRGAAFVDAGDAFSDSDFDTKVGVGVGVHYMTPVGAIKLEVANSVSEDEPEWSFYINIGAEF